MLPRHEAPSPRRDYGVAPFSLDREQVIAGAVANVALDRRRRRNADNRHTFHRPRHVFHEQLVIMAVNDQLGAMTPDGGREREMIAEPLNLTDRRPDLALVARLLHSLDIPCDAEQLRAAGERFGSAPLQGPLTQWLRQLKQ